jgi:hypothetical protein
LGGGVVALKRGIATGVLSLIITTGLLGCAIVDQYSGRALSYNLEAEDALGQGLLLNIVRGALRRPMQFTSVQSITGTASASGSGSLTIPIGAGGAAYKTGVLTGTASGGPSFTVPVLDTQEFYQGVMSPIPGQLFDFFIHEEYPRAEIFTLFVEKIVITRMGKDCPPPSHTLRCELTFVNYPGTDLDFDLTQSLIEHLINLGMTTEALAAAKSDSSGGASTSSSKSTDSSGNAGSSGKTLQPDYRFCFSPKFAAQRRYIAEREALCGFEAKPKGGGSDETSTTVTKVTTTEGNKVTEETTAVTKAPKGSGGKIGKKSTVDGVVLSGQFIDGLLLVARQSFERFRPSDPTEYRNFVDNLPFFKGSKVSVQVYTRSTEGILYFLGETVRRHLFPETDPVPQESGRILQVKIEHSFTRQYSERPCYIDEESPNLEAYPFSCENLFVLDPGLNFVGSPLWVGYNGRQYAVPSDPMRAGKTLHVLSIVKQLLAVNTSAKALPQTNVIGIVSP